ncbi:TPA: hypothetical protein QDC06_005849 [Burkholderia cepacia]|nr:hypothetical protein [Burkholderia metallica]HDR9502533.1 hypothetical protein [Burkholderia cepacia]
MDMHGPISLPIQVAITADELATLLAIRKTYGSGIMLIQRKPNRAR